MKYRFISKYRHPIVIVKAEKRNSEGDVLQEPVKIYFDNWMFNTDDENLANIIRKNQFFGSHYWEDDGTRPRPVDESPQVSISTMDRPEELNNTKIVALENEVKELHTAMNKIVELLSGPKNPVKKSTVPKPQPLPKSPQP